MTLVLGVDGGGTKTLAVVMNGQRQVLGQGQGGPSNFDDIGVEAATRNLDAAIEAASAEAGLGLPAFDAVFFGLAGVVSEADRRTARGMALELGLAPPERIGVDHDCRVALAGGLSGRPGIVLIAGTGSSCFGMNAGGDRWLAGGWGHLLADEGSGYWLGLEAMRAAVQAHDGRGQSTALMTQIQQDLSLGDLPEIMNHVYVSGMSRTQIAALAPAVLEIARKGDPLASKIVRRGAAELARCVAAVMQRLRMKQSELVVAGGVLTSSDFYQDLLVHALDQLSVQALLVPAEHPPAVGAALLALGLLDGPP